MRHPVFDLVDPERLRQAAHRDTPVSSQAARRGLERTLDLAMWLDLYDPEVSLA
jgi:asparagine synthase (glutamine-hydrolysing)